MIERQIVAANVKEFKIQEYVTKQLKNLGQSHIKLQKTPLGEKIIIHASRPGLIVGRKGQNIKKLTEDLKTKFNLENPQIEINEVEVPDLDAQIVAERVASSLEKFGTQRFKGIGHRIMTDVMDAGALGIEILISGKIPSSRSKRWRFYRGYLKKCGYIAIVGVRKAYAVAQIKTGIVGIQVRIMPPDIKLPDTVNIKEDESEVTKGIKEDMKKKEDNKRSKGKSEKKEVSEETKKEKKEKKKSPRKTTKKKDEDKSENVALKEAEPKEAKAESKDEPKVEKKQEEPAGEDNPAEKDAKEEDPEANKE